MYLWLHAQSTFSWSYLPCFILFIGIQEVSGSVPVLGDWHCSAPVSFELNSLITQVKRSGVKLPRFESRLRHLNTHVLRQVN